MQDTCQIDVIVSTKLRQMEPSDAAKHVFSNFRGCRVLSSKLDGAKLKVALLLPDVPGGYSNLQMLRSFIEEGLYNKSVALASVHGVREATPVEMLDRVLGRK